MRSLQDILVNDFGLDLTGWRLDSAAGISADGLTIVGTGFSPDRFTEAWIATLPPAVCGNGIVETGEECDDGAGNSNTTPDACRSDCTNPSCGDGVVDSGEQCDDSYTDACGSCNTDCSGSGGGSTCGDATLCPQTEECDDGYTDACGSCNADCTGTGTGSTCGDATLCPETEECDDSGTVAGDGCSATCTVEPGSKCTGEPSVCITGIPAVSTWGLIAMALLVVTAGTLVYRHRMSLMKAA